MYARKLNHIDTVLTTLNIAAKFLIALITMAYYFEFYGLTHHRQSMINGLITSNMVMGSAGL